MDEGIAGAKPLDSLAEIEHHIGAICLAGRRCRADSEVLQPSTDPRGRCLCKCGVAFAGRLNNSQCRWSNVISDCAEKHLNGCTAAV